MIIHHFCPRLKIVSRFKTEEYIYAGVVELVDTHDSKSCEATHEGSSPSSGTRIELVRQRRTSSILVRLFYTARTHFQNQLHYQRGTHGVRTV